MAKLKLKTNHHSYVPIALVAPDNYVSEQYRKLRTNIDFSDFNQTIQTIALTSTIGGEGKTVTTINLGVVYAQSESKTLIIDMDLRKPKLHRGFNLINKVGLTDIITDKLEYKDVIQTINPHLDILTSGTKLPFPSEFLMSKQVKNLMDQLKKEYDRIIIDTPPMSAVSDASVISRYVDGFVIVVASRLSHSETAQNVIENLKANGAKIIGSVLTRIQKKDERYYRDYYYTYDEKLKRK